MKKIYRPNYGTFAGVCTGIGEYLDVDPLIIKIIFILALFTPFPIIWSYLILWFLIPKSN